MGKFLGIPIETLIIYGAALGSFLTVLALGFQALNELGLNSRLNIVRKRREELKNSQRITGDAASTLRQKMTQKPLLTLITERLKLTKMLEMKGIRTMLSQAGWRDRSTPSLFLVAHLIGPVFLGGFAALVLYKGQNITIAEHWKPVIVAGSVLLALVLPTLLLKNAVLKRQKALEKQFPDSLDLLLVCVEAGLSVEAAFSRVTEELGETTPEASEELALTSAELAFLGDRRIAFENMVERTGMQEFKSLATTLIQSERYGTPVASSLRVLSEESRKQRMLNIEKKAAALPAKLTVPMIVFFLPCLFLIIIGPAIIQL